MRRTAAVGALVASLVCVSSSIASAQVQVGGLLGATFSELRGADDLDNRSSLLGGLSLVLPLGDLLRFQPELLFVTKGAEGSDNVPGVKLSYVEVPLLLRLNLTRGVGIVPHVYAGPYFGLQIDCEVDGTSGDCDNVPGVSTKSVDIGGAVGGGLDFDVGPVVLTGGLRYSFGVSKVADFDFGTAREEAKNGVFAIYAGLGFRLGSRN
jgi:hypothetical protein